MVVVSSGVVGVELGGDARPGYRSGRFWQGSAALRWRRRKNGDTGAVSVGQKEEHQRIIAD